MKKARKTIILYPLGTVQRLAKEHGVTEQSVRKMLKFEMNSDLAKKVREDCLKNYGGKVTEMMI